jgi:hypothetical protein
VVSLLKQPSKISISFFDVNLQKCLATAVGLVMVVLIYTRAITRFTDAIPLTCYFFTVDAVPAAAARREYQLFIITTVGYYTQNLFLLLSWLSPALVSMGAREREFRRKGY